MRYNLACFAVAAKYGHGTKITGERTAMRREYLEQWLAKQPDEYFEEIAEDISHDRGEHSMAAEDVAATITDFMEAPLIRRRGDYVPRWQCS